MSIQSITVFHRFSSPKAWKITVFRGMSTGCPHPLKEVNSDGEAGNPAGWGLSNRSVLRDKTFSPLIVRATPAKLDSPFEVSCFDAVDAAPEYLFKTGQFGFSKGEVNGRIGMPQENDCSPNLRFAVDTVNQPRIKGQLRLVQLRTLAYLPAGNPLCLVVEKIPFSRRGPVKSIDRAGQIIVLEHGADRELGPRLGRLEDLRPEG